MAENSKIEWTHHTANLWHGCTKVHAGCDHCYAETLSHRWGRDIWGNDKPRLEIKSVWNDLKRYQQLAAAAGEIHRVFVGSMMDIFEKPMPIIDSKGKYGYDASDGSPVTFDHLRDQLFDEVIPSSPNLLFLLLTKRPSNIIKYIPDSWIINPPTNVMFGTSPANQETHDTLVKHLLKAPGKHFLSIEPLLGPITLKAYCPTCDNLLSGDLYDYCGYCDGATVLPDWVIAGGESGRDARPMDADWVRTIRDDCKQAGVPFFFKQWGEYLPVGQQAPGDEYVWASIKKDVAEQKGETHVRVGKKMAGRMLDGFIHNEFPK